MKINISKYSKAEVLAVLYNASKPQGMGFTQYDPKPMTVEDAESILETTKYFDYLRGRVMKIGLDSDEFDPTLYDRDNGRGHAAAAIATIPSGVNNPIVDAHHKAAVKREAQSLEPQPMTVDGNTINLGMPLEAKEAAAKYA